MQLPSRIQARVEKDTRAVKTFNDIVGCSFEVYNEFHGGLLESAYESALAYLLDSQGYKVEHQKELPMYFKGKLLDKTYRMDLVVDERVIVELKAVHFVSEEHRRQLWNYMHLTHMPYGILVNFGDSGVFSQKFFYDAETNDCHLIF